MNSHTSIDELLAEVRSLETYSGMLDGTIRNMELQLEALRASKAKVDEELDMYRAALEGCKPVGLRPRVLGDVWHDLRVT